MTKPIGHRAPAELLDRVQALRDSFVPYNKPENEIDEDCEVSIEFEGALHQAAIHTNGDVTFYEPWKAGDE